MLNSHPQPSVPNLILYLYSVIERSDNNHYKLTQTTVSTKVQILIMMFNLTVSTSFS